MNEATKRCPFCDEEIRANAIKCKHCGSFLTDTAGMAAFSKTAIRQALMARFEIIDEIGRGGMGVVYKAIQKNLNRPVALKILPQHLIHQEEFLKRFHGEAQKAAQLNHKNIITVYDEGEEHGVHFISMEFIDGQNLKDVIVRNGPLPVATMMQWIKPVVDALGYAHNKGMIHRDIKSANILISKEGRPVLTDFGIARVMEDAQATRSAEASPLTRPGTILGTLQYMSPEQVQGKAVDGRSDIYSIGVVMYQCLTGELPFRGDTDWSAMHKITSEVPTPPRGIRTDIPPPVEAVVLRCMAKNPADRYQNCDELLAVLERVDEERTKTMQVIRETPVDWEKTRTAALPIDQPVTGKTKTAEPPVPLPAGKTKPGPLDWKKIAIGAAALAMLAVVLILVFGSADRKMGPGFSRLPEADQNRVRQILQMADALYQDDKLLLPPGNNAWEKYREVFTIHKNNRVAQERLALIRNDLLVKVKTQSDYAAAKSLLQRGLECFPADRSLLALDRRLDLQRLEQQAHAHISKQRFVSPSGENAYEVCQKMLALDPANQAAQDILKTIANWFLQEGERLVGAGQSIKAAEIYRQALQFFPKNAEFSKRRQELVGAVAIDKTLAEAKSAFDRKDWKNAWNKTVEILNAAPAEQSALELQNKIKNGLTAEAANLIQQSRYAQALECYNLLKQCDPQINTAADENRINELWGDALFGRRFYTEAIRKYQAAQLAEKVQKAEAEKSKWLGIELAFVPGGSFVMGDVFGDGESDERPAHTVQLNRFYLSKYEITFEQYDTFCKEKKIKLAADNGWGRGNRPAINVTWFEAKAFCSWLAQRTGANVRLPTEAEWEYAARAGGRKMKWAGTDNDADLNQYAWLLLNSDGRTHPVGEKRPNSLGLFDMSGNVYEWCLDRYDERYYGRSAKSNPVMESRANKMVRRGGSALDAKTNLRGSNRSASAPDEWKDFPTGFRVVCTN